MAKICITGFYGYNNAGDEGILLAIMDSLGENKYVVCTTLPYNMLESYQSRFPKDTVEVRQIYDVRSDYDAFILGGGALGWGYGWHQAITAFSHEIPSMNYGVGYNFNERYHPRLNLLYITFLQEFDAITVRDKCSQNIVKNMDLALGSSEIETVLTGCPSINLKEEPFDCPKGMIAVCPRYEDWVSNDAQLDWLTNRLRHVEDEVLLIPFAPSNLEGIPVDLELCLQLKKRLRNSTLLPIFDGNPRKFKYVISQSKLVISGGRYHPIVWASAHNVPFEVCPTSYNYPKVGAFEKMHAEFGGEKLKEMEKQNKVMFEEVMKYDKHT